MAIIVTAAACDSSSRRALFSAFRQYRDCTPMQFLAERRLQAARQALTSPYPGDTVTSIAYSCGFSHLGRFSDTYRKRFGGTPSETLREA